MPISICMNDLDADSFASYLLDRGSLKEVPDFLPKDGTHYVLSNKDINSIPKDKERIQFIGSFNPNIPDNMFDISKLGWNQVNYIRFGRSSFLNIRHITFSGNYAF